MFIDSICIVGGGSAGWMTAATFSKIFPEKRITLIDSADLPPIGVGESTTQFIRDWMKFIDLKDEDWMNDCDATYKYSVRFENFNKPSVPFHYPFIADINGFNLEEKNASQWFLHQAITGESVDGFAEWFCPQMKAIHENRIITKNFDRFDHYADTAFHFDATKLARWLKENRCQTVEHIRTNIVSHKKRKDGSIEYIRDDNNVKYYADLFVDCTGFRSLLINGFMNTGWDKFDDMLPNDSAWAVRLPYTNKREEMKTYTNCTALKTGWVWRVCLQNRMGTGYNYSTKFISDEDALAEFKEHLGDVEPLCEFRNIKFKTGLSQKPWNKNVLAMGLSGGFIEPLESNGLLSIHDWLMKACQIIGQGHVTAIDIASYNKDVRARFTAFAEFVFMHYGMSARNDTPYWKYLTEGFEAFSMEKFDLEQWTINGYNGIIYIMAGHNWNPFNPVTVKVLESQNRLKTDAYIELSDYRQYDELIESFPYAVDYYES